MVGGGEKRTGAALEEGNREEIWGDITTTVTYFPISFYSPEVNCAMCVLSEAILVLFARAAPEPVWWV